MIKTGRKGLVLGANGFLGWNACLTLLQAGWEMIALDKSWDLQRWSPSVHQESLEIREASVFDRGALRNAMADMDAVFSFLSFSVPATNPKFMQAEIQTTLQAMEIVLSMMVEVGAKRLVFPSSGGTVYGDIGRRASKETDPANPLSSYGMGKLLCEHMALFYHRIHGLEYSILRIANAYGANRLNRISQGLIDVFLEKFLAGEELVLWGGEELVRDYVFIDDVMDAMLRLIEIEEPGSTIANVGSGAGSSIGEVLSVMRDVVGPDLQWKVEGGHYAGLPYNVLDITKIHELTGWTPGYKLEEGIREAWRRKTAF